MPNRCSVVVAVVADSATEPAAVADCYSEREQPVEREHCYSAVLPERAAVERCSPEQRPAAAGYCSAAYHLPAVHSFF